MAESITRYIDHSVLKPTETDEDLRTACRFCIELQVATVCVKPYAVPRAAKLLAGSGVDVSTVIGFPHGGSATQVKVAEARAACAAGARELDMVVNLGHVLGQNWDAVAADIGAVVDAGKQDGALTKVIVETGLLPDDALKVRLCEISAHAGAAFVKTSTGFGFVKQPDGSLTITGATRHDVQLLRAHCADHIGVKASGGIRTYAEALQFIRWGATRLGTSSTQTIAQQQRAESAVTS
ncbi:MAG: deoxyribose-phosphate aldolase [Planctomycetes bacterium RBG_16_64_10]|nr:MAG: deoxyribose-phosphate aldolase [Planctomycetes bacterium RBG_16_64_10]